MLKMPIENVAKIVRENIAKESRLHTDESALYKKVGAKFVAHERANHGQKNTLAATSRRTRLRVNSLSSSAA